MSHCAGDRLKSWSLLLQGNCVIQHSSAWIRQPLETYKYVSSPHCKVECNHLKLWERLHTWVWSFQSLHTWVWSFQSLHLQILEVSPPCCISLNLGNWYVAYVQCSLLKTHTVFMLNTLLSLMNTSGPQILELFESN